MLAAAALLVQLAVGFEIGDAVPTLQRIAVGERTSDWSALARRQLPIFGVDSTATARPALELASPAPAGVRCTLALTFDADGGRAFPQHALPLSNARDATADLTHLDVLFTYAHHEIRAVRTTPTYASEEAAASAGTKARPASFELRYRWERVVEEEVTSMLHVLFFVVTLLLLGLSCSVCLAPVRAITIGKKESEKANENERAHRW